MLLVTGAFAQTPTKTFEAASVKPAAPLDMAKMQAAMANGQMPKIGMQVHGAQVEFLYLDLKTLVSLAYKLKPYQVTGPDWMATQRFDILAKLPSGATRDDIPQMLQALLKDRLKVEAHLENKEHPVLGLIVGKGGPKLTESKDAPKAIDETVPLGAGEMSTDGPDGPIRVKVDMKTGTSVVNMGAKGTVAYKFDQAAGNVHLDGKQMTMAGFVEMLSQFTTQLGGPSARQIVDMTGLKGYYEVALDISLADLLNIARASGMDVPNLPAGGGGSVPAGMNASDPSGAEGVLGSVQSLGLKLENRKAVISQLVVDHAEKTATEN